MKPWKMIAASILVLSFAYQNCSRAKFAIDESAKSDILGKDNVFNDQGDDGQVVGDNGGDDGSALNVTFSYLCSNKQSSAEGGNLLTASAVKLVITDAQRKAISCTLTGDYRSQILNSKSMTFAPCSGLAAGSYIAHIVDASKSVTAQNVASNSLTDDLKFKVDANGVASLLTKKVEILYDLNSQQSSYATSNSALGNTSTAATQAKCDSRASPLIISMNSKARGIELSAPLAGIQFDILGQRSFPVAHAKKQISWFLQDENEYYFIALPNSRGQVQGIDELFGDNTRGPDGKYADNGYAALAKYDDDQDGYITSDDEIFSKLRLWKDDNRNGIAESGELYTLKELGISMIDLHYDARYKETDKYGNQTKMKSVVKTEDGKLHLMFDLWFRYVNIAQ